MARHEGGGIVIAGGGIAGLFTALACAPVPVTLVTADTLGRQGSSAWAQGGLAAAVGADDSAASHLADTIAAGAGLVEERPARILCEAGPDRIDDLVRLGVPFDRSSNGTLLLGAEAAHSAPRIVHVKGDEAGAAIIDALTRAAMAAPHITLCERTIATRVLTDDKGVAGLQAWDIGRGRTISFEARHVVLATGGIGGLFAVTTNPLRAQGHGLVLAHEAGATLRDLEFVQFHPTGIDVKADPAPLATEALRGDGATLHDRLGRRFMPDLHPDAELAPRDVVARGVAKAIAETGRAFLDTRRMLGTQIVQRYPTVTSACRSAGIDPVVQPIPVAPAAHYHMGGILTDTRGRSDVEGLYAVGECASTGVHGANRLASNSLLEALVFGHRAAMALRDTAGGPVTVSEGPDAPGLPQKPAEDPHGMRAMMADHCGLLRRRSGLQTLISTLETASPSTEGDRVFVRAAGLIARSAIAREESRGSHWRTDFPDTSAPCHTLIGPDGIIKMAAATPPSHEEVLADG